MLLLPVWKIVLGAPKTWGARVDWMLNRGLLVVWWGWMARLLWEGLDGGLGLVTIWGLSLGWVVDEMRIGETVGERLRLLSLTFGGTGGVKGGRTVVVAVVGVFSISGFGEAVPSSWAEC